MKPLKTRVSLTLDENLVDELRELADRDERSVSQYVNIVLRDHLQDTYHVESNKANKEES